MKRENPEKLLTILVGEIVKLVKWFDRENKIQRPEINEIGEIIISEFWYLKIEEIQAAFKLAKSGKIGKVYKGFAPSDVIEILREYETFEGRINVFETKNSSNSVSISEQADYLEQAKKAAELIKSENKKADKAHKEKIEYQRFRSEFFEQRKNEQKEKTGQAPGKHK